MPKLPTQFGIQVFDFDFDRDIPIYGTQTLDEAIQLIEDVKSGEIQDFREQKIKTYKIKDGSIKRVK